MTASASMRLVADMGRQATEWAVANPGKTVALGAGAAFVAAPMVVAAPALAVFGFGANGVVAGSVAAGAQSGIGSVVAPSLFAMLQSAGAGGYGVATVSAAVQGLGGAVASSAGVMAFFKKGGKQGDGDEAVKGDEESNSAQEENEEESDSDKRDDDTKRSTSKL